MLSVKRILYGSLIVLIVLSINHDLSKKSYSINDTMTNAEQSKPLNYTIVKQKILPGDTFLSIIELINPSSFEELDIDQLIADFIDLNPKVNPHQLIVGHTYYFPKY